MKTDEFTEIRIFFKRENPSVKFPRLTLVARNLGWGQCAYSGLQSLPLSAVGPCQPRSEDGSVMGSSQSTRHHWSCLGVNQLVALNTHIHTQSQVHTHDHIYRQTPIHRPHSNTYTHMDTHTQNTQRPIIPHSFIRSLTISHIGQVHCLLMWADMYKRKCKRSVYIENSDALISLWFINHSGC